jgi:hypothetical protein
MRHPVVITSLEEDFKRIGLLKEGLPKSKGGEVGSGSQGHAKNKKGGALPTGSGGEAGSGQKSHKSNRDPNHDYGRAEDTDVDDEDDLSEEEAAYTEAVQFAEDFAEEWDSFDEDDSPEIELSSEEMAEFEDIGESVTLDTSVFDALDEDDDDDDDDDEYAVDEDEDEDELDEFKFGSSPEQKAGAERKKTKGKKKRGFRFGSSSKQKRSAQREDDDEVEVDDEDEVDEGRRRSAGGRSSVRTTRQSGSARAKGRAAYKRNKFKITKQRKVRGRSSRGKKLKRLAVQMQSADVPVASMLDNIESLTTELDDVMLSEDVSSEDVMAGFANVALVSEMLVTLFAELEESEGEELVDTFTSLAESSAEFVEMLHEHDEDDLNMAGVESDFREYVQTLMAGIEITSSIEEDVSEDDDSDDDDESDEYDTEEDDEQSEEDSEGKEENAA